MTILQVQNHFFASAEAVLGLAAHLLVQTDQGGGELVLLLLQMGAGGVGEVGYLLVLALLNCNLCSGWNRAGTKPHTFTAGRAEHPGARRSASQTRGDSSFGCFGSSPRIIKAPPPFQQLFPAICNWTTFDIT